MRSRQSKKVRQSIYEPTSPTLVNTTLLFFLGGSSASSLSPATLPNAATSSSVPETLIGVAGGSLLFSECVAEMAGEADGGRETAETDGVVAGVREAEEVRGTEWCWAIDWNWRVCC